MDSASLIIGLLLCGGLAVLAWVIDPGGLSAWRERGWFALARDLGLRYRARAEAMGPRLSGEYQGVEIDIDLRAAPSARMVLASPQRAAELRLTASSGAECASDMATTLPEGLGESLQEALEAGSPATVEIVAGVMPWRWSSHMDDGRMRRDLARILPLAARLRVWLLDATG